jgi:hypothetical protein
VRGKDKADLVRVLLMAKEGRWIGKSGCKGEEGKSDRKESR